jgi:hypothetical protein
VDRLWWTIAIVWVVGFILTMALMKAASDADDQMLGDKQYEQTV